nr:MAG TPA: ethanolamine utilization protein [Bacteriophage sp.]
MTNAGQTTYQLVDALRRAGWGILRGSENRCARSLLATLAGTMRSLKTDARGYMTITAAQLADRAGYSERHVRRWLPILEDLGILSWSRGWIEDGRPQPGSMKLNKNVLVKFVNDARVEYDEAILPLRAAKTKARLARLRLLRIKPYARRCQVRADMASGLSSYERAARTAAAPRSLKPSTKKPTMSNTSIAESKGTEVTKRITFQAYMQEHYPNQRTDWPLITDRDPIAYEIAQRGSVTPHELDQLNRDMNGSQLDFEVA